MVAPRKELNLDMNYSLCNSFYHGIRFLFNYVYERLRVYFFIASMTYNRQITVYPATKIVSKQKHLNRSKIWLLFWFIFSKSYQNWFRASPLRLHRDPILSSLSSHALSDPRKRVRSRQGAILCIIHSLVTTMDPVQLVLVPVASIIGHACMLT